MVEKIEGNHQVEMPGILDLFLSLKRQALEISCY